MTMKDAHRLMQQGVARGVFPGGVLHVRVRGRDLFCEPYGQADIFAGQAMTRDTVFDLASLTKPLAMAPAVLKLVQEGDLHLDVAIGSILPEFHDTDKQDITPAQLLTHTSGLPAHRDYFLTLAGLPPEDRGNALIRLLAKEPLVYVPGKKQIYSDLGYMVIKYMVEAVSQKRLDVFIYEKIYRPLGIDGLFYVDLQTETIPENTSAPHFAATEDCSRRQCLIKGTVHDDNAYEAGGIAGHAGLFGTTTAVAGLLESLLGMYSGKTASGILTTEMVRMMLEPGVDSQRTLGFDTPDKKNSSAGSMFSNKTVGHLGFTGVSMWLDVVREAMVLVFTNRIHPDRSNDAIKMFRPLLHNAVMAEIIGRR